MRTPPPLSEMFSSSYSLLKVVYLTGQWRHSLEVHPLLRKILDLPLHIRDCKLDNFGRMFGYTVCIYSIASDKEDPNTFSM